MPSRIEADVERRARHVDVAEADVVARVGTRERGRNGGGAADGVVQVFGADRNAMHEGPLDAAAIDGSGLLLPKRAAERHSGRALAELRLAEADAGGAEQQPVVEHHADAAADAGEIA